MNSLNQEKYATIMMVTHDAFVASYCKRVLFNIAKKNVEKNLKGYFLYFFSTVFTVCIYYSFKSLQYNPSIDSVLLGSGNVSTAFNAASVVIALFSVLFIYYSNSFFIKKRKKEIGLYALLGIEK